MALPPVFHHHFRRPLPYYTTLLLQEYLHRLQLARRKAGKQYPDLLLLLEHRPVYTAGRRQTDAELQNERKRLEARGADFVHTQRGGELTYHGPGQIVGYPLLDLGRSVPPVGVRDYICLMQKTLKLHLREAHNIDSSTTDLTGVFLAPDAKIASIGVQIRHRLTTHGFALNITNQPLAWFEDVVACGLDGVKATSVSAALGTDVSLREDVPGLVRRFGQVYERDMVPLDLDSDPEVADAIRHVEKEVRELEAAHEMAVEPTVWNSPFVEAAYLTGLTGAASASGMFGISDETAPEPKSKSPEESSPPQDNWTDL